jgi:hypothetical protein
MKIEEFSSLVTLHIHPGITNIIDDKGFTVSVPAV